MSIGVLGKKVGMTQVFDADGRAVPVTVIEAGPCLVVEIRTPERNRYSAVQLGFGEEKPGYAGVMKRHNFGGGAASHGASKVHRKPGSIGSNSYPGHIFKGKKMAGRMGGEQVTTKGLTVFSVDAKNNLLLVRGDVPGANDQLVLVYKTA